MDSDKCLQLSQGVRCGSNPWTDHEQGAATGRGCYAPSANEPTALQHTQCYCSWKSTSVANRSPPHLIFLDSFSTDITIISSTFFL